MGFSNESVNLKAAGETDIWQPKRSSSRLMKVHSSHRTLHFPIIDRCLLGNTLAALGSSLSALKKRDLSKVDPGDKIFPINGLFTLVSN
jgi:hypothetical protein